MDLGFATHGVHMDQRLVFLNATLSADRQSVSIIAPPSSGVYPPGPGYLFFVVDGGRLSPQMGYVSCLNGISVPSVGQKVMIGSGANPPVDNGALAKSVLQLLFHTSMLTVQQPAKSPACSDSG